MIITNPKCLLQLFTGNLQVFSADFAQILGASFDGCLLCFFINKTTGADPEFTFTLDLAGFLIY